jgi:uncharacterized protein
MARRRIAVVGSGIAGLTAACVLSRSDDVALFEADDRLGGPCPHPSGGRSGRSDIYVDSGFIVHNKRTYPLLTRLFAGLGVAVQPRSEPVSRAVAVAAAS